MDKERRRAKRVPVYMKVINESKEQDFGFSYAKNISEGGMALDTKVFLDDKIKIKEGSNLKLKFKVPGGKFYITSSATVIRIEKQNLGNTIIGVKFSGMTDDFKREIKTFVNEVKKGNLSLE